MKQIISTALLIAGIATTAVAQTDNAGTVIADKINKYHSTHLREKIFVHTDKSFYLAGETMWYKLYVVNAADNTPLNISKVGYAELLDRNGRPVAQAKLALDSNGGPGSFQLPMTLVSGTYVLRAYTNLMKNYGAEAFFEKKISVVNSLKNAGLKADVSEQQQDVAVQLFPEGGNLVANLASTVAFKVTDNLGNGIAKCSGYVVNERNDTVARFAPLKFGMGNFTLTPQTGEKYRAIVNVGGRNYSTMLPTAYSSGAVMHLTQTNGGLQVEITGTNAGQTVYMVAHSNRNVLAAQTAVINSNKTTLPVDVQKLNDGITIFTLFNADRKPLCERLFFKQPAKALSLNTHTEVPEYDKRSKVNFDIAVQTEQAKAAAANMSVAIFQEDSLQSADEEDIFSYLWLTSEIKGNIESPAYYVYGKDANVAAATDNLMMTQGWRGFDWSNILDKAQALEFLPEYEGHLIKGTVVNKHTNQPQEGIAAYVSSPGKAYKLEVALSDRKGQVLFNIKDLWGADELIAQVNQLYDSIYRLELASPFSALPVAHTFGFKPLDASISQTLLDHSIQMQVENAFAAESNRTQYLVNNQDTTGFYGTPTFSYKLDDYTRFTTMEEVLREYVKEVLLRKRKGKFYITMVTEKMELLDPDPLVMLDGVPYFDADTVLAFDPLKIRRLEVLPRQYIYGPVIFNGIMNFSTYKNDMEGFQLPSASLLMDYEGLQLQRQFYSPVYNSDVKMKSRMPDMRNVLYWSPNVQADNTGKSRVSFFTSDRTGKYVAIVQALDTDGRAGSKVFRFAVTDKE